MTTQTEKQYAKLVGKLYWSMQRQSLVMVTRLQKSYGRWRFTLLYTDSDIKDNPRTRDASEIIRLIKQGRWITAAEFITLREKAQAKYRG